MTFKEKVQEIRHVLYRVKLKLVYNSGLGKAIRRATWKPAGEADGLTMLYRRELDVFRNHTMNHIRDPQVIERFSREIITWNKQADRVYFGEGDIIIEPKNSLAFFTSRKFIEVTRSKAHEYLVPDLSRTWIQMNLVRKFTRYEALVHFDGFVGKNLYHFFEEAVNAQLLLMKTGLVPKEIPLLIHEKIFKIEFVQYVLALPEFKGLNWVVQRQDEWIRVKKLYKAVSVNELWKDSYALMAKHVPKNPHRKIFLNRTPFFQRRLTNNDAVEAIVRSYGFEVVYAEHLTYAEQVQLFADTKYFIALHGAGVTNLIYSDLSQLRVMELFSESLINPHFYWFLELLGVHYYDAIAGTKFDINWNYSIDEERFKEQLGLMMAAD